VTFGGMEAESKSKNAPQQSLMEMMKSAKPVKVMGPVGAAGGVSNLPHQVDRAVRVHHLMLARAVEHKEFMLVRDFNVRAVQQGSQIAVVLATPSSMEATSVSKSNNDAPRSPRSSNASKVLPIMGFVKFQGNVPLDSKELFDSKQHLHISETDFESTKAQVKRQHLIGWHFTDFTLSTGGVLFLPSTGTSQQAAWLNFFGKLFTKLIQGLM